MNIERDYDVLLRDYFAASAMQGMLCYFGFPDDYGDYTPFGVAMVAYEMADAMLKARK